MPSFLFWRGGSERYWNERNKMKRRKDELNVGKLFK
jgi:hypothetical protein